MVSFSANEVNNIPMKIAIGLMREAFQLLSEGKVIVPLRTKVETEDKSGIAIFMPSYAPSWNLFGIKLVSVFANNPPPLPSIHGQMLVMDARDGRMLAQLDAPAVTALRTGAASGLATELLAGHDASTLAIFGTGAQAWTQVAGVCAVRNIRKIFVKGTSTANEAAFCKRVHEKYDVAAESLTGLRDADIICTATTSETPLFDPENVSPRVHINAIGSYKPTMREIPDGIIASCKLVVDQRRAVMQEAGEVAIPIKNGGLNESIIYAELGEIVTGKSGRKSESEITVFKSVGNAIQDLAVARYLLETHSP